MNVSSRRRVVVLYVLAAAMLISLGGRLYYLQVMNNTSFTKLAQQNQTRDVIVPAVRGQILDDVGNQLVTNTTALVVSVDMMTLNQEPGGAAPVLRRLAPLLGMSYTKLSEETRLCTRGVPQPCWAGSPYQPIPVDQNVSDRVALQVMEEQKEFPGVTAQVQPVIDYPEPAGANPAQVLGYLQPITPQEIASRHLPVTGFSGVDLVGQAGLEAQYDSQLRGKAGTQVVSVNAAGDVTGTVSQTPPTTGDDLVTSINAQIQADVQRRPEGRHRPVTGRGERRQPGRGGRDDYHRPGRGHGQLPGLQPERVDRRHLAAGVQRPVRHRGRGTDHQLGGPGPVRPGIDLQGHLDRRRRGRRIPAGRPVQLPRLGQHRQRDVQERRRARASAT